MEQYKYFLPEELIASEPAEPRDAARLLIFCSQTGEIQTDTFLNLDKYLPADSLLVLNKTKVLPARVSLKKETGGRIEVLFLLNEYAEGDAYIKGLVNKKLEVGQKVSFESGESFLAIGQEKNIFNFQPNFEIKKLPKLLFQFGITPIPKYLGRTKLSEGELRERYQSVFAEKPASVAAPTASLHFTERVFQKLSDKGIQKEFINLNVGLGTFAPVTEENLKTGKLHEEFYEISKEVFERIKKQKEAGAKIIAVGTTTVRALESSARGELADRTELFIRSPFEFKLVGSLITNFHLPNSSLMALVDAFLQFKKSPKSILEIYDFAIQNRFRFYSFGDAMLIV